MKAKPKNILLYLDSLPALEQLSPENCGRVVVALLRYARDGEEASGLEETESLMFSILKSQVDRDREKYQKRCEKNREIAQRRENEKKSRQKEPADDQACPLVTIGDQTYPNVTDRDTDRDRDTDTDRDIDRDRDTDTDRERERDTDTKEGSPGFPEELPVGARPLEESFSTYREIFVESCPSLPQPEPVELWSQRRKGMLRNLGAPPEEFRQVCQMVEDSDFLTGRSGKWYGCSLDWLLQPANWQKVREGNYRPDPKPKPSGLGEGPSFDLEAYEAATGWNL